MSAVSTAGTYVRSLRGGVIIRFSGTKEAKNEVGFVFRLRVATRFPLSFSRSVAASLPLREKRSEKGRGKISRISAVPRR